MTILITGGSGLIGQYLVKELRAKKHEVRILSRSKTKKADQYYWNIEEKFIDEKALENLDCLIHLAGASVSKRWTKKYKTELYSSRIDAAQLLLDQCTEKNIRLKSFISASGINYYGTFTSDKILHEDSGVLHHDFLADLSVEWEKAAEKFHEISKRVVCLRTALVLAKNGGALEPLKKITSLNIGSAVGSGKQWMNWIHITDLVKMYVYTVENSALAGSYNAVADEISTNAQLMRTLSKVSGKLFIPLNVPELVLKSIFGEMSAILLTGTRTSNEKIKSAGFDFEYSSLETALQDLI